MIRCAHLGYLQQIKSDIEAERWAVRWHSQEFLRAWGPWMTRYEYFKAYEPPPEAKKFGAVGYLHVEHWWRNADEFKEARTGPASSTAHVTTTPGTVTEPSITAIFTARPTEDFLGKKPPPPESMPIIRWMRAFKYPEGVSDEEGDKWYLNTYTQQAKQQEGLLLYVGYRCIKPPLQGAERDNMHRVEELWYTDFDAWRKANITSPPSYTPPPWGKKEEPFVTMVSNFLRVKPTWDWLRYHYPTP
ncbi:MAG: hypothetical protein HYX81_05575 [Chloroflexi bacterium]|nr:hypothetical protein [Chloroflexota bacterium]